MQTVDNLKIRFSAIISCKYTFIQAVTQKVEKIAFKQVTTENVFAQAKAQAKKIEGDKQSTLAVARKPEPVRPFAVYEDGKENHVGAKSEAHVHHVADKR
jgi:hypothetical protein